MTTPTSKSGATRYTLGMNLLAEPWGRALSQATYDAYMLAVADASADDFDTAIRSLLVSDLRSFPTPYQLRAAIRQARVAREASARALFSGGASRVQMERRQLWVEAIAALGVTPADTQWWWSVAREHNLPSGVRDGLFVPPCRDRHAVVFVRTLEDADRYAATFRAPVRASIERAMTQRYGLICSLTCVGLPDVFAEADRLLAAGD